MSSSTLQPDPKNDPGARSRFAKRARSGGWATLLAIGLTVAMVSVPCVEAFAVRANEHDARVALHLLQDAIEQLGDEDSDCSLHSAWQRDSIASHRMTDARPLSQDRLLYHGYVLAWVERQGVDGGRLLAWPRLPGATGRIAYELSPEGTLRSWRSRSHGAEQQAKSESR